MMWTNSNFIMIFLFTLIFTAAYNLGMISKTEAELLQIRQKCIDALRYLESQTVVNFALYKRAFVKLLTCDELLREYRYKKVMGLLVDKPKRRSFV